MNSTFIRRGIALMPLAFCSMAHAHPGHANGVLAGVVHPLLGLDHLLAMLAVGLWAAQLGGRAKWLVPASFVLVMAVAGSMRMAGIALPMVESGIATSVLLLGLLIAFSVQVPSALGAALVGLFAVFHGYAHGAEIPLPGAQWQYCVGFVISTAALHGLGVQLGRFGNGRAPWLRAVGAVVAASGAWMMSAL